MPEQRRVDLYLRLPEQQALALEVVRAYLTEQSHGAIAITNTDAGLAAISLAAQFVKEKHDGEKQKRALSALRPGGIPDKYVDPRTLDNRASRSRTENPITKRGKRAGRPRKNRSGEAGGHGDTDHAMSVVPRSTDTPAASANVRGGEPGGLQVL